MFNGSPQHFANLDFSVPAGNTGSISYTFAKSPKGGTADIYLDGVFKQTVSYAGSVGSTQAPEFKPEYQVQFGNLSAGAHKLEIKNLTGVVYVDRLCLQNSNSNAQPTTVREVHRINRAVFRPDRLRAAITRCSRARSRSR